MEQSLDETVEDFRADLVGDSNVSRFALYYNPVGRMMYVVSQYAGQTPIESGWRFVPGGAEFAPPAAFPEEEELPLDG